MLSSSLKRLLAIAAAGLVALPAQAAYSGLVIFGDSLSDSGNNFLALNPPQNPPQAPTNITPAAAISSNFFVPTFTYAPSASYPLGVYSNGPVWATSFAASLGLGALPSLAGGGDFAFGGARTSGGSSPSLIMQTDMFLGGSGNVAPGNYLYVVAGGGNNARDALDAIGKGADIPSTIATTAAGYASDIGLIVDKLQAAGAKDIVVWNTPNLGLVPAVGSLGSQTAALAAALSGAMNAALNARLDHEIGVDIFDLFGLLGRIVANPQANGLGNVKDACILGACPAAEYMFWDGIHPTERGHQLLAAAMLAQVVPEPQSYLLVAVALAALAWRSRRRVR